MLLTELGIRSKSTDRHAMKAVVILVTHGMPPNDFPKKDLAEYFKLHMQQELITKSVDPESSNLHDLLDARIRAWPRNPNNDPYKFAVEELATNLANTLGLDVLTAYNEFCSPSLEECFEEAAKQEARKVIVTTNMLTKGGQHAEIDIPAAIQAARLKFPELTISYVWPFDPADIAAFLAAAIKRSL